jgi:hypothetical protein
MSGLEEIKQDALKKGVVIDRSDEYYMEKMAKWFVAAQSKVNKRREKRAAQAGRTFSPVPITYSSFSGLYQLDLGNGRQWIVPLYVFEAVKFFANVYKVEVVRKRRRSEAVES